MCFSPASTHTLPVPDPQVPRCFFKPSTVDAALAVFRTGGTKLAHIRWRSVLSQYKLDGWQTAASIFRAMVKLLVEPDATHHNAVLSACVVGKGWQQSGAAFDGISQQNLEPDILSLTTLAGLSTMGAWVSALDMLSFTRRGLQVDRIICCEVLKSFKRSSKWTLSLRSLARMSESYLRIDSVSCSHFMSANIRWLVALQAMGWFQLPQGKAGLLPFNILQNSYSSTEWESAAAGLEHACHSRFCPDEISFCVSLKKQRWLLVTSAFALLQKMLLQEVRPNINCYNCLVHVCSSNWPMVLKILLWAQQHLILPDTVTLNTCIGSIAAEDTGDTWALPLVLVKAAGVQRDSITWLSVLEPLAWSRAVHFLRCMPVEQLRPSAHCTSAVTKSCKNLGLWRLSLSLLSDSANRSDCTACSAATATCAAASSWQMALYLTGIERWGLQQDNVSLNSCASVLEKSHAWSYVLCLLEHFRTRQVKISQESHRPAISACGTSICWVQALACWENLQIFSRPDIASCNVALSIYEKRGLLLWRRTLALWRNLHASHFAPDDISFNAAISDSVAAGVEALFEACALCSAHALTSVRLVSTSDADRFETEVLVRRANGRQRIQDR